MVNVALHGAAGKMCHKVFELAQKDKDIKIIAGVDISGGAAITKFPVFATAEEMFDKVSNIDVVIDFSDAEAVFDLVNECVIEDVALVICTTGLDHQTLERLETASKVIPIMKSANMSIGVNFLLKKISEFADCLISQGFDVEIVEKHHNQKRDAPSGTAMALADAITKGSGNYEYVYDRSMKHEKRDPHEIGISSVRGGTIVGEHDIIFAGEDEVITLSHQAFSKAIFAKGAIAAAKVMARYNKNMMAGLFDMGEIVG